MSPEKPRTERQLPERAPGASVLFSDDLNTLQRTAGPVQPALPQKPSEADLNDAERNLTGDNMLETFAETFRANEIQQRRHMLQREAMLKDPKKAEKVDRAEMITVNQAATYYAYIPSIVHNTMDIMRRYEALRSGTPVVSEQLKRGEAQAQLYIRELERSLAERTAFANVLLVDGKLARHVGDAKQLMKLREQYLASTALSASSRETLTSGSTDAKWRQGNMLNQRIVDVLAGSAAIPGVAKGFLPQQLHITLLSERYKQAFEDEKNAVRDVRLIKARARHDELNRKNERARAGKGEELTDVEAAEYEKLRLQIADREAYMNGLSRQRKELQSEIISFTNILGEDHMQRAEMSTIQNQFGNAFTFEGVSPPNPEQTPNAIRKAMGKQIEQRKQFHLERFEGFMGKIENDVLNTGVKEWVEDLSNKKGREVLRWGNHALTNMLTKILPEEFGLRESAREKLTQPLDTALGWPPGKDNWEDLTAAEQENVLKKSQSVLDAIKQFDRSKIVQFRGTIGVLKGMPDASTYLNQPVTQPLPTERVTAENRDALIEQYGGATVYMMLFAQMDGDWDGFMAEYGAFLEKVNTTIDVHMDVGGEIFRLGSVYDDMKRYILYAALLGLGVGAVGVVAAMKVARSARRLTWRTARLGGRLTKEGSKKVVEVIGDTAGRLKGLRSTVSGKAGAATEVVDGVADAAKTVKSAKPAPRGLAGAAAESAKKINIAQKVDTTAKAVRTVEKGAETIETFDDLLRSIKAAKEAKNNKEVVRLLRDHTSLLKQASKAGNAEAKALSRVARLMSTGRWAVRALPFVATLIDAALLGVNEMEIKEAKRTKNAGMQKTLESKRATLLGQGGVGLTMFAMSGPQIAVVAPVALTTGLYTHAVYDAVIDWEKSSADWLKKTPEELRGELNKRTFNYTDIGQRTALGDSVLYRGWKKLWWKKEDIQAEDDKRWEAVEEINRTVRQEALTAYFLKTMPAQPMPGETEKQFVSRQATLIRDRLSYISRSTNGSFVTANMGERYYERAGQYGNLAALRRSLPENERKVFTYEYDGKKKELDLTALDYVSGKKDTKGADMELGKVITQYMNEVLPQLEAQRDLQALPEE